MFRDDVSKSPEKMNEYISNGSPVVDYLKNEY